MWTCPGPSQRHTGCTRPQLICSAGHIVVPGKGGGWAELRSRCLNDQARETGVGTEDRAAFLQSQPLSVVCQSWKLVGKALQESSVPKTQYNHHLSRYTHYNPGARETTLNQQCSMPNPEKQTSDSSPHLTNWASWKCLELQL